MLPPDIIRIIYLFASSEIRLINRQFRDSTESLFKRCVPASQLPEFRNNYPDLQIYEVLYDMSIDPIHLRDISRISVDLYNKVCNHYGIHEFLSNNAKSALIEYTISITISGSKCGMTRRIAINGDDILDVAISVHHPNGITTIHINNSDIHLLDGVIAAISR